MNNTKLLNLINLSGGSNEIVKIDYLNNMIDEDEISSTSEYTESYLDGLDTSDIDGGKGKGPKGPKKAKGPKSPKGSKSPKSPKGSKSPKKAKPSDVDTDDLFDEALDSEAQTSPSKKAAKPKILPDEESEESDIKVSPSKKKSTKPKSKVIEEFDSDSDLEAQVRESFGKKSKGIESMLNVKPNVSNLSKLTQTQSIDSEEELGNIINNYVPTTRTSGVKAPGGISKLASIATQVLHPVPQLAQTVSGMAQHVPNLVSSVAQIVEPSVQAQVTQPQQFMPQVAMPQVAMTQAAMPQTTNITPSVNFSSLSQAYTIVPMLVPTSALYRGQFGGKINKKLEQVNKQIEALEDELF